MLGIIEGTLDGDGKYVFRLRAGHLAFLQRGNLPVGIEDEHRDPTLAEKAGDCGGSRVAGSSAQDGQVASGAGYLDLVEVAQKLKGEILECQSWAMEKLQDLAMVAQFDQGRGFRMPETGIGRIDNPLQDLGFEIGSEKTEELEAKLR